MALELNVNVKIGMTEQLAALIGAAIDAVGNRQTLTVAETKVDTPADIKSETDAGNAAAAAVVEKKEEKVKKAMCAEDVRAAIDRARDRIEGDDWRTNRTSDRYKRYHKALNAVCCQISTAYGAAKPSGLAPEYYEKFIADCDRIVIDDNGELTTPPPF